jgi:hypothetical protein
LDRAAGLKLEPPSTDNGIMVYGAGELGALAIEYCEACSIPVAGLLDREKIGSLKGRNQVYTISKPSEASWSVKQDMLVAIAVATMPFSVIREHLKAEGWRHLIPFYQLTARPRSGHPLRNGWMIGETSEVERNAVEWINKQWSDDSSRLHFEAFIAWHSNLTELLLSDYPIQPSQRYLIRPLIEYFHRRSDQMVDVGSHHGESVRRLYDAGIKFREYRLIEPDSASREHLTATMMFLRSQGSDVAIIDDVLLDTVGSHFFQDGLGYCSQVWERSTSLRNTRPLDDLELKPDFLKIHTEGSEIQIFLGARKTILKYRPAFAISVYHSRNGFCSDIAEIMQLPVDYRYFFRLHSYQGTGGFVYAIPR